MAGLKTLVRDMDIFDSKSILFTGWNSWLSYTENAVTRLLKGVFGVVYAIVVGIVSALYKLSLFLIRKIREWPLFSFMLITIILCTISLVGFVNLTVKSKMYEYQRDSVKYELDCFKQTYGGQFKPYLRPMSSMTEKEQRALNSMCNGVEMVSRLSGLKMFDKAFDWLNAHHFDYRGLIDKGLALEAPEGMYNLKEK